MKALEQEHPAKRSLWSVDHLPRKVALLSLPGTFVGLVHLPVAGRLLINLVAHSPFLYQLYGADWFFTVYLGPLLCFAALVLDVVLLLDHGSSALVKIAASALLILGIVGTCQAEMEMIRW